MEEKVIKPKPEKKPKEVVEYFTDEMAKNIFPFQDKISKNSSPSVSPLTFKTGKRK
jgi:hypothetical protein